ncbi:MAG: PfaD family polyunsaturated fatty acid/polyketide biosynthesis protein [Brevibacterium linens]|uniref:PfaD family polyunsaturated fatty acid/polyketide biosynthesis protein n=1 Tax=Brevibacterium linens TaxID=1703 RepID=UPI003F9B4288
MTTTTESPASTVEDMSRALAKLTEPVHVCRTSGGVSVTTDPPTDDNSLLAAIAPLTTERLGSSSFRRRHGVRHAYMAGSMANGIASVDLVTAMARGGYLASYGAGGVVPDVVESSVVELKKRLLDLPFAVNVIHSPNEPALERGVVDVLLRHRVRCVEASAFMDLTPSIVRYRAAGLSRAADGSVCIENRVIAKVSRTEVAERFLNPPPASILADLVADEQITAEQAELAARLPVADDITAEADSGGHTDRRPLPVLLPILDRLRTAAVKRSGYMVHLGAAGGIGTPRSLSAALALGADYVVTGSINQSCIESGTSPAVRKMLCGVTMADCVMAPAADMFELGVELQVARRGSMFPMRASKLYSYYRSYRSIDEIPSADREELEKKILQRPVDDIWFDVEQYFNSRDPEQIKRARNDPRRRMALIFRWYLGMSTRWAQIGDESRSMDYQVWCGPAMGAFNDWVTGTPFASPAHRSVVDVAEQLCTGAAVAIRYDALVAAGVRLPQECGAFVPKLPEGTL